MLGGIISYSQFKPWRLEILAFSRAFWLVSLFTARLTLSPNSILQMGSLAPREHRTQRSRTYFHPTCVVRWFEKRQLWWWGWASSYTWFDIASLGFFLLSLALSYWRNERTNSTAIYTYVGSTIYMATKKSDPQCICHSVPNSWLKTLYTH